MIEAIFRPPLILIAAAEVRGAAESFGRFCRRHEFGRARRALLLHHSALGRRKLHGMSGSRRFRVRRMREESRRSRLASLARKKQMEVDSGGAVIVI